MKILINIPTWLGDAVMCTPSILKLVELHPNCEITLIGSMISNEALKTLPNVTNTIIDDSKKSSMRLLGLQKLASKLQGFDFSITFRQSISSALLLKLTGCPIRIGLGKWYQSFLLTHDYERPKSTHQVQIYTSILEQFFKEKFTPKDMYLNFEKFRYPKKTIGINPGASYGNAKRWYPKKFAQVAIELSKQADIIIFGGPAEVDIAKDIEIILIESNITNFKNLAGKTKVDELISKIAGLDLFVTGDSGPMHVATAYQIPLVSIFGPTDPEHTHPWQHKNHIMINKKLDCAPCMKRKCPLEHHQCMKDIGSQEVIEASLKLLNL
ncbi:MAG: lipopolysaccharide heptosyltransferase II [Candidatus Cloacimonadota bacterium]|nr:MAG: lipopolysaccharide heptosyltransferase II [Candidatus Cloacimonadota bacterium]